MTYFGFLARFLMVPLSLLAGLALWNGRQKKLSTSFQDGAGFWIGIGLLVLLAVIYTTPWDNYLAAHGVWKYSPFLVSGWVWGWVPVEEYTFFILETLLTGLWWRAVAHWAPLTTALKPSKASRRFWPAGMGLVWLGSMAILISGWHQGTYLGLILVWALPSLVLQFAFGADILLHYRKQILATVMPVVIYLSAIDALAIQSGTWRINPVYSTGIFIGGLPVEEALFFLFTALMIACGLTLALTRSSQLRWKQWRMRSLAIHAAPAEAQGGQNGRQIQG